MKKLLVILGLLAFLAFGTQAQTPTFGAQTLISSNSATAFVGGNAMAVWKSIDVSKQQSTTLQISMKPKTTATDVITLVFAPSVDGLKWGTNTANNAWSVLLAPSGTAGLEGTTVTNMPTASGVQFWTLTSVSNAGAGTAIITNLVISYGQKISSP